MNNFFTPSGRIVERIRFDRPRKNSHHTGSQRPVGRLNFPFRSEGYDVISASDAFSATNIAQTDKPDVIILDLSLPGLGGYHVMERLKSSVPLASVPIIVLTAGDAIINGEEALKKRAEAFFLKPFDNKSMSSRC
jgi:CheY-like chemotaxis protein